MSNTAKYYYPKGVKIEGTRLTPTGLCHHNGMLHYELQCECGNTTIARPGSIGKKVLSCGCLGLERRSIRATTHGLSKTPEYFAAWSAHSRCTNPKAKCYKGYGGRGIRFEFQSVEAMTKWLVKNLPKPKTGRWLIDRINNNGHYAPGNLKWSTSKESCRNQRRLHQITIGGKTMILADWSKASGVHPVTIRSRISLGLPEDLWLHNGKITKTVLFKHEYSKGKAKEAA